MKECSPQLKLLLEAEKLVARSQRGLFCENGNCDNPPITKVDLMGGRSRWICLPCLKQLYPNQTRGLS